MSRSFLKIYSEGSLWEQVSSRKEKSTKSVSVNGRTNATKSARGETECDIEQEQGNQIGTLSDVRRSKYDRRMYRMQNIGVGRSRADGCTIEGTESDGCFTDRDSYWLTQSPKLSAASEAPQ